MPIPAVAYGLDFGMALEPCTACSVQPWGTFGSSTLWVSRLTQQHKSSAFVISLSESYLHVFTGSRITCWCVHMQAPQCTRAMHMSCAGLDGVPMGDWYCPQHARMAKARKASMRSSFSSAHAAPDASLSPRPPPKPASKGPRKKSSARQMPPSQPGSTPGPHEPSPSPGSTIEDPLPDVPKMSAVEALAAAVAAGPAAKAGSGAKRPRAKRPRS